MGRRYEEILTRLRLIEDYEFEHFIADLWEKRGWETTVSQESRDGGIDVIARKNDPFPQKHLIQAKKYRSDGKVGVREVREYSSLLSRNNVDAAVIVTTGSFTSDAESEAKLLNVKLIEGDDLAGLIEEHSLVSLIDSYLGNKGEEKIGSHSEEESHDSENLILQIKERIRKEVESHLTSLRKFEEEGRGLILNLEFTDVDGNDIELEYKYRYLREGSVSFVIKLNRLHKRAELIKNIQKLNCKVFDSTQENIVIVSDDNLEIEYTILALILGWFGNPGDFEIGFE